MKIVRNKIEVPTGYLTKLENEFGKSRQTIYNALWDITQSNLAKRIRTRAKEILLQDAKNIEV